MDLKLDEKLFRKYPNLYADRHKSMQETCMVWGFECGDGWYKIIDRLSAKLEALIIDWMDAHPDDIENHPRASQVKEKYGTLRFYMTSWLDEISPLIDKAKRQSSKTCEVCGRPGKVYGHEWLSTRCATCWKMEQKEQ